MDGDPFDAVALEKLKLAAEEMAWMIGRGYPRATVLALVSDHHALEAP
jgi:hypothetical protein